MVNWRIPSKVTPYAHSHHIPLDFRTETYIKVIFPTVKR